MSVTQSITTIDKGQSLTQRLADKFKIDRDQFIATVKATCIKDDCTNEQFAQFLMVADEYNLNPFTKEIYAFPSRGGIQPIVSIDGWLKIINSHQQFDGMQFEDTLDDKGNLVTRYARRTSTPSSIQYVDLWP